MSLPLSEIIKDEIALDGLEGITLRGLWQRLSRRCPKMFVESPKVCSMCWDFIKSIEDMSFYKLPAARPDLVFRNYKELPINLNEPNETTYKTNIIERDGEMGSCEDYDTRQAVPRDKLDALTYDQVMGEFGNSLVVVASLKIRYKTLIPEHIYHPEVSAVEYCILEKVGRARDNGMSSTGKHYLADLVPDSRSMFFRRKILCEHGLIHTEITKFVLGASQVSVLYLPRFKPDRCTYMDVYTDRVRAAMEDEPNGLLPSAKAIQIFKSMNFVEGQFRWKAFKNNLPKSLTFIKVPRENQNPDKSNQFDYYLQFNEKEDGEAGEQSEEVAKDPFLNLSNQYFKLPQCKQLLLGIEEAGPEGITRSELVKVLGSGAVIMRSLLKTLIKDNLVYEVKRQDKKSVALVVVASIYKDHKGRPALQKSALIAKAEKPKEQLPFRTSFVDIYGETTTVTVDSVRPEESLIKMDTEVRIRRAKMVQEIVAEMGLCVTLTGITNIMREREGNQMCRRTTVKLLHHLAEHGAVSFYVATFQRRKTTTLVNVVCDPNKYNVQSDKFQEALRTLHKKMVPVVSQRLDPKSLKEAHCKLSRADKRLFSFSALKPFHKFLVHLAHFAAEQRQPIREVPPEWQELMAEGETLPAIYDNQLSWRTFLPPRPTCDGWVTLRDIASHIPLQLFRDLYHQLDAMLNVPAYLNHPVKRHYMLSQCPNVALQHHGWCHDALLKVLNKLCFIGLLRFGETPEGASLNAVPIYLNKRATVIDTITMDYMREIPADAAFKQLKFEFSSPAIVNGYWDELTRVCLNTQLGRRFSLGYQTARNDLKAWLQPIGRDSAERLDDGSLPGDGKGAAGLHSKLMAHQYSYWDASAKKRGILYNKKRRNRPAAVAAKGTVTQAVPKPKPKKNRVYPKVFDDVDVAARTMVLFRTKWSSAEDTGLLLARLANLYLSTNTRNMQNISAITYRDVLHWMCLSLDKSAKMCSRRVQFLMNNDVTKATMQSCLKEMRTTKAITSRFGPNFAAKLKEAYPLEVEFLSALKIHFVELVRLLSGMYSKFTSDTLQKRTVSSLPDTVEEFEERFVLLQKDTEQLPPPLAQKLETAEEEVQVHTIYNAIHSSMCCAKDHGSDSLILLDIYKNYSEEILMAAMQRATTNQLISKFRINHVQSKRTIPLNTKPFHLSIYYTRHFRLRHSEQILSCISQWVDEARANASGRFMGISRSFNFFYLGLIYRDAIDLAIRVDEESQGAVQEVAAVPEKKAKARRKAVCFSEEIKVKEFEYQSTEILLKVNPINWHVLCYLKEVIEKKGTLTKKQILITEGQCNFACFVHDLQDFDEAREFMAGINVKEFRDGIKGVLADLKAEKEKAVEANKKDLGSIRGIRRTKKKFIELLVDLSQDNYSPLNHLVTEVKLKEGAVFPRHSRLAEMYQTMLNWSLIGHPKVKIEKLFSDPVPAQRLLNFIEGYSFSGASGPDLIRHLPEANELERILKILLENHFIVVCGENDLNFVHRNYVDLWTVKSFAVAEESRAGASTTEPSRLPIRQATDEPPIKKARVVYYGNDVPPDDLTDDSKPITVRMFPWVRVTGTVNKRVVDKVLSTLLLFLQGSSGIPFPDLAAHFKIFHPAHLKLLLWLMVDLGYIKVFKYKAQPVTLWSTPQSAEVAPASCLFDPTEELYVECTPDSLLSFCENRDDKKYFGGYF